MSFTSQDEDLLADGVLTLHADTTDLTTVDTAIIASCFNPPPPPRVHNHPLLLPADLQMFMSMYKKYLYLWKMF
jgi:hypothetical protein